LERYLNVGNIALIRNVKTQQFYIQSSRYRCPDTLQIYANGNPTFHIFTTLTMT